MNPKLERFAFGRPAPVTRERASVWPAVLVLARALIATIFVWSGLNKIFDWSGSVAYMDQAGMVAIPFFLAMSIVVEIVGGLSIFTGTLTRIWALILFLYLIPVTWLFHDFWNVEAPAAQTQFFHFLKNLALMGGLLYVLALGADRFTVDHRIRRQRWTEPPPAT